MAQAKIYWDIENYTMVEKIFKQSAEFCSEHEIWKLNVAHIFFMQVCLNVFDFFELFEISLSRDVLFIVFL